MFTYPAKKSNVCSLACNEKNLPFALSNLIPSFPLKSCLSVLLALIDNTTDMLRYAMICCSAQGICTCLSFLFGTFSLRITVWFYSPLNSNFFYDDILSERLLLTTLENSTSSQSFKIPPCF